MPCSNPFGVRQGFDHIQITVSETLGVEQRGDYYDHSGALRGHGAESHAAGSLSGDNGAAVEL